MVNASHATGLNTGGKALNILCLAAGVLGILNVLLLLHENTFLHTQKDTTPLKKRGPTMIPEDALSENPPIMLANEIAQKLNIGRSTAYRLLNSGKIPKVNLSCKIIGAYRTDVLAFIDSRNPTNN